MINDENIKENLQTRILEICNEECISASYIRLVNEIIEKRKILVANFKKESGLLYEYDKLNNDLCELLFQALYIEGFKDGISLAI